MFSSFSTYKPFQNQASGIKAQDQSTPAQIPQTQQAQPIDSSGPLTSSVTNNMKTKAENSLTNTSANAHSQLIGDLANKGNPVAQSMLGQQATQPTSSLMSPQGNDAGIAYKPEQPAPSWMQSIAGDAPTSGGTTAGKTAAASAVEDGAKDEAVEGAGSDSILSEIAAWL